MHPILDNVDSPKDLRKLKQDQLPLLASEIREMIIDVVSRNGGHLAPSLGVVDLTLALHYTFDTPKDRIIWDVGHQAYAHKIITGRRDRFSTLRTYKGISGFPKITESEYDSYTVGHSSTSLSLAIGDVVARDLKHEHRRVIAVIGDGSLTGGMSYEALNQIGHLKKEMIIILNDNEHSISKNVGAMSAYLTRIISGEFYNKMRKRYYHFLKKFTKGKLLWELFLKTESRLKGFILPGQLFEELGLRYFGPIDGHNIGAMIQLFERLKHLNSGPKMVHVITRKGKGYKHAENDPSRFHGIGPFVRKSGESAGVKMTTWSEVAGKILASLGARDEKIVAVTAAMKDGTGLTEFERIAPRRLFDVGIAEEHAVTFAAGLARNGLKPFVALYSTFLQRSFDQLVHDVGIMNLPVKFLIDRAGIVGDDGETHHGLFDIALLRNIPNFTVLAPSTGAELRDMVAYAASYNKGPIAIRYPRGAVPDQDLKTEKASKLIDLSARVLSQGKDCALLAAGDMVGFALELAALLRKSRITCRVVNLFSLKPLDMKGIIDAVRKTRAYVTLENGYISGGIGEEIISVLPRDLKSRHILSIGFPDIFITHGKTDEILSEYGISVQQSAEKILAGLRLGRV
jgi:1-deoxy-D-xylulose-5-phosphate synthase